MSETRLKIKSEDIIWLQAKLSMEYSMRQLNTGANIKGMKIHYLYLISELNSYTARGVKLMIRKELKNQKTQKNQKHPIECSLFLF